MAHRYRRGCHCRFCDPGGSTPTASSGGNRARDIALQTGAAALSVGGYLAEPGQSPNTGQLGDVHDSQMERNRDTIEDRSHEQGTGTSQGA